MPSLSVIVPSAGTRSLKHCLWSFADQLELGDELIVELSAGPVRLPATHPQTEGGTDWGYYARQVAMQRASREYVMFLDDDDECLPGALACVREAIVRVGEPRVHLFRMVLESGAVIWDDRAVVEGNVSSQMIVAPNVPERLGSWLSGRYASDFDFIEQTVGLCSAAPVWEADVICRTNRFKGLR